MGLIIEGCRVRVKRGEARKCPFCGSDDIAVSSKEQYAGLVADNGRACVVAECTDCHAEIHYHGTHDENREYGHMIEMVLKHWNGRHNKPTAVPV